MVFHVKTFIKMENTTEIVNKNNKAILRRFADKIRILEPFDFNPKLDPNNPVYNTKLKL